MENYITSGEFSRTLKPMSSTSDLHTRRGWLENNTIMLDDVCLCCYPDGPSVLKDISSGASSGEIIGTAERTSARRYSSVPACSVCKH